MNQPSQEDLLGYVLGALDAQEQRNIQQHLDEHPETEEQLLEIKTALAPLEALDAPGGRPGLARRTCELVATIDIREATKRLGGVDAGRLALKEEAAELDSESVHGTSSVPVASVAHPVAMAVELDSSEEQNTKSKRTREPLRFHRSFSMSDALVAVAALAIIASILVPAVSWSRYNSRLLACQSNLRQVGAAFMTYSSNHGGQFISIPDDGNLSVAGCFGPLLKEAGLLESDSLLACAGLGSSGTDVFIPSRQQIESCTNKAELTFYQQVMGGHFGHSLGHRDAGKYEAPRNGQSFMVLLADRPSSDQPGRVSQNHAGRGQNCLFADGRVTFVAGHAVGEDALFENDYGVVAPGFTEFDNVIAPSHLSPVVGLQMSIAPSE